MDAVTLPASTIPSEPSPAIAAMLGAEGGPGYDGWGELFVCLGEVDIPNVYGSNLAETPTRIRFGAERYGVDIIAPGHPNWSFPTNYVMRNGFRCTVIYARGPVLWQHIIGVCSITVDVCGWKNLDGVAIDQAAFDGIVRWVESGRPVVITSRALRGRVGPTYGYPGGGRRVLEAGAIFAYGKRPLQARIDTMLALGLGMSCPEIRELFAKT
jgi:hypothetical protein